VRGGKSTQVTPPIVRQGSFTRAITTSPTALARAVPPAIRATGSLGNDRSGVPSLLERLNPLGPLLVPGLRARLGTVC